MFGENDIIIIATKKQTRDCRSTPEGGRIARKISLTYTTNKLIHVEINKVHLAKILYEREKKTF